MEPAYAQEIKGALENLLDRLEIRFEVADFDDDLHAACHRAASDRGISLDRDVSIGPYIPLGVVLAKTAYAHLPGNDSRIYIALFTAALAAVEDLCRGEYELLKGFCLRYWRGLKHGHPILDDYDLILRELPQRFEFVVADMMLQSNMDFITSLVLEYDMQDRPMSLSAKGFPVFFKNMSGAAKIYSLLAYTKDVPLLSYIEAIPASMTYVNFLNDVFSFYRGELLNESVKCISDIARCNGKTKRQALQQLIVESAEAHKEALAVLSEYPDALQAFEHFSKGLVLFFISSPRHKVADLWSTCLEEVPTIPILSKPLFVLNPRAKWKFIGSIYAVSVLFIIISIWFQISKQSFWFFSPQ